MAKNRHSVTKKRLSLTEAVKKDDVSSISLLKEAAKKLESKKPANNLSENTKSNKQELSKLSSVKTPIPKLHKKQYEYDDIVMKSMPSSPRNEKHKKDHVGLYTFYKSEQLNKKPDKECQSAPVSPRLSVKIKHKNLSDKDLGGSIETKKNEGNNLKSEINILKEQLRIVKLKLEKAETRHKDDIGMLRLTLRDLEKARIENQSIIDNLLKISDELIYSQQVSLEQIGEVIKSQEAPLKQINTSIEGQKKVLEQAIQSLELTKIIRNQISPSYTNEQKIHYNQVGIKHKESSESSNCSHEQIYLVTTDNNYEEVNSIGKNSETI